VLHLVTASEPGGLSRYVVDMSTAMTAQEHAIAIAGQRGSGHALFEQAQLTWIDVPLKSGPLALLRATQHLREYLAVHPVDVLHTHYRRATLVARSLQRAARRHGERPPALLYTLHLSHLAPSWIGQRLLNDWGDHTHAASEQARQWLIDDAGVASDRITVIPHGIQPARFPQADAAQRLAARQTFGLSLNQTVALYVGRLDYPKNVKWLLDLAAVAEADATGRVPDLRILLVGGGPEEATLRAEAVQRGLQSRVLFTGHLDNPLPAYQAADALLLPSLREGFSLVTAEAMSVGIPVLRTRTSGSQELILEGVTGQSIPIERDAFIAAAIEFLGDRSKLAQMGQAAALHVREHFTFERQVEQTIGLYRRLVKN
jgi:glycosyltransferase involved in cell wall biosynthesis